MRRDRYVCSIYEHFKYTRRTRENEGDDSFAERGILTVTTNLRR
jgi:hypothetical protein